MLVTVVISLQSVPNNWDSLVYHLPRIEHWLQNKSINPYPTHIDRQLYMSPFSEIAMMQVRALGGMTNAVNLIEWFSMVGSILCVSLLAKEFGLDKRGQILAMIVAAAIPSGIVQSTNTTNDYVVTFFILCFIYIFIVLRRHTSLIHTVLLGSALGLATLTKPTAYFYLFPFIFWYAVRHLKTLRSVVMVLVIALMCNTPNFIRQYSIYQNIFGPEHEAYIVGSLHPAYMVVNAIKNISLHLGMPNNYINTSIYALVSNLSNLLLVNVNDPHISWKDEVFHIYPLRFSEVFSGNSIHLFLICVAYLYLLSHKKNPHMLSLYLLLTGGGFVLIVSLLRWSPWNARMHLPFFVMMSPIIAYVLVKMSAYMRHGIIVLLVLGSFYYLFFNEAKSVFGEYSIFQITQQQEMFMAKPELLPLYNQAINYVKIRNYRKIGIKISGNDFEYPLWYMLHAFYGENFELHHVDVLNPSGVVKQNFIPEVILCNLCRKDEYVKYLKQKPGFENTEIIPLDEPINM
jgi:4-amino-4-deoxy-L-arabinose transferase-like glycosyltransferase